MTQDKTGSLYGRRKGHALGTRQQHLMDVCLPRLSIALEHNPPDDLAELFPGNTDRVIAEIGFGSGEHLVAGAQRAPCTGFIGAEAYVNGLASILGVIEDEGIENIRLHGGDGEDLLCWLPDTSIDRIDLCYLDPWRKRRHWKRRFVSSRILDEIARVLRQGATLRFVSDWPSYVTWALMHLQRHPDFSWTAQSAEDWRTPWEHWPGTRYEAKALCEGRKPAYLEFLRL